MPRVARIVVPGIPHHVTQRGNNRQDVFFVDDDRRMYLDLLHGSAQRAGLHVLAYCLMTNHVHLIVVPQQSGVGWVLLNPPCIHAGTPESGQS